MGYWFWCWDTFPSGYQPSLLANFVMLWVELYFNIKFVNFCRVRLRPLLLWWLQQIALIKNPELHKTVDNVFLSTCRVFWFWLCLKVFIFIPTNMALINLFGNPSSPPNTNGLGPALMFGGECLFLNTQPSSYSSISSSIIVSPLFQANILCG
jgi:hypothetical protein